LITRFYLQPEPPGFLQYSSFIHIKCLSDYPFGQG
jgi:hypothetical protein